MRTEVRDWNTVHYLSGDEAKEICKLGQGKECCAFLVSGIEFECWRMNYPNNSILFKRLKEGSTTAKGRGEWPGCPWHVEDQP